MDYQSQPLSFQIRKILRYCRMYGLGRTYVKVQGFRHKKKRFQRWPRCGQQIGPSQIVGLIGCGNYAFTNIAYYLTKAYGRVIAGCMDVDPHHAASLSQYYKVPLYTSQADELIDDERIRLMFIASNHASHAEYAIQALEKGKDVYIEKPHVVSEDQLSRLVKAMTQSSGRVYLGFNRPSSRFGKIIRENLDRQSGTGMFNWFVVGHAIDPDHWYYHPREGGRVPGNLCHWTDFLYLLAGQKPFPVRICPTRGEASDVDIVVTYTFADGSIGVISFSAKGQTFEGVKERFSAHKGDCLISMDDYQAMTVDVGQRKRRYHNFYRDQGHRNNIVSAFENSINRQPYDRQQRHEHIANTALLFLKTKEALERNEVIVVEPYQEWLKAA